LQLPQGIKVLFYWIAEARVCWQVVRQGWGGQGFDGERSSYSDFPQVNSRTCT
jgi:hypothetical protein